MKPQARWDTYRTARGLMYWRAGMQCADADWAEAAVGEQFKHYRSL